ncbi:MAG TPA: hypothetical protein DCQ94_03055, partial [Nitrospira sp.]|nr:hypothetical protein [Nitrospira sp.]
LRREVVTSYADECEAAVRVAVRWEQRHHDGDRRALKIIGVLFEANNRVLFIFVVFFIASWGRRIGHRLGFHTNWFGG